MRVEKPERQENQLKSHRHSASDENKFISDNVGVEEGANSRDVLLAV